MSMVPSDARRPRSTVVQQVASVGILALLPLLAYAVALLLLSFRADEDSRAQFLHEVAQTQVQALQLRLATYADLLDLAAEQLPALGVDARTGCSELFERLARTQRWIVGGGYVSADGSYRCATPPARLELSVAHRPHFADAAAGARIVVSQSVISRVTGEPTVFLARRLEDGAGRFAGVVQFAVRPEALTEVLLPASGGPIQVRLVSVNGAPVASSGGAPVSAALHGSPAGREFSETRRVRFRDADVGFLTVSAPVDAFESPMRRWGTLALAGFALAALASGLLGVWLLRRSLLADSRALDAMVRTAAHDPDAVSVPSFWARESSDVARAFAGILRRLRSQQRVLESVAQTLRARSAELEQAQRLARLGAWECDPVSRRFDCSAEVLDILGLAPDATHSLDELVAMAPQSERAMLEAAFSGALSGGRGLDLVHRILRPDGTVRRIQQRAQACQVAAGEDVAVGPGEGARARLKGTAQDVTDLESSREQVALFEAALGGTDDIVVIGELGPDTAAEPRVVWVNPALLRLVGRDRDSLVGAESTLFEGAAIDPQRQREVVEALLRGEASRTEIGFTLRDGARVWLELHVSPILGRAGIVGHWVAVGRDTTARRTAEHRVRASEARYRHLFDDHPLPLWIYDLDSGAIADVNRAGIEAFGYGREEFLAMRVSDLVPPEHRDELDVARRQLLGGSEYGGGLWCRRRDGTLRRVEVHGATTEMDGRRMRIISPIDRTEEFAARGALERLNATLEETVATRTASLSISEQRYRTLAELSPQVIWQADARGRLTFLSRRWQELVGEREAGWLGMHWVDALPPADVCATRRAFADAARERRTMRMRRRIRGRDGQVHSMLTAAAPVFDADGSVLSWVGVDTDVGELESVQQELNEAVERQEAFSYSVSHDLRAPVHVIAGFAGVLLDGQVGSIDDEARHYVGRIAENARRMETLITDLLALSRLGREELAPQSFELVGLLREVIQAERDRQPGRDIELEAPAACEVRADPNLVRILLENLVGNAVKFSSREPVSRLRFEVEKVLGEAGEETVFSLADNGVGFPAEYAGRMFQPFQRLHGRDEFEGSGIGLAIVARIVGMHRGRVWAESGEQGGAKFAFTLGPAR
ncbi:PAS domain S-box protein [Quisquiliibacterium transsilvanicum]|uniref:histidine kinase n=1 Tax=Quisquiliibacterium transsilvanicum TaxID=1549638 RepID=A0A7W8HMN5_9BURK|nr:PAS domain S-box protein [Quisquiliibacterium transsilvanicum]MBB5273855.1 PAS domain S-box-containing protein [Quisquiliibacterium transsilvanicum]